MLSAVAPSFRPLTGFLILPQSRGWVH